MEKYRNYLLEESNNQPKNNEDEEDDRKYIVPNQYLESVNNKIYFYGDVDKGNALRLNKMLDEIDSKHVTDYHVCDDTNMRPIYLNINSYGGSIFDGLSIMDQIQRCKSPVVTVVDGVCASAATLLSLAGVHRMMKRNSFMLIHELKSKFWGRFSEFKDEQKNLTMIMNVIKEIYLQKTKIKKNKLEEILKKELYFNAKQCLRYGLIDQII